MGLFSGDNMVWVNNRTAKPLTVVATPNKDFLIPDAIAAGAIATISSVATLGGTSGLGISAVATTIEQIARVTALMNTLNKLGGIYAATVTKEQRERAEGAFKEIQASVRKNGVAVPPGQTVQVNRLGSAPIWGLASVSGWAQQFGAADYSLMIVVDDFSRIVRFDSNSDHSWIFTDRGVIRAKYGTLDVEQPNEGCYRFSNFPTMHELNATARVMRQGHCLVSPNGRFAFVLQDDGNAVVYDGKNNQPIFHTGTSGKAVDRLDLQADGNLVLYGHNGEVLRATSKGKSPEGDAKGARLCMQDDGNLCLYNDKVGYVWDSFHRAGMMQS